MFNGEGERIPVVHITEPAKQKLDYCIRLCDYEISGLGEVSRLGNDFLISKIHLFNQEVTGGSTDLSTKDVSGFMYESIRMGLDPSNLKFWWHSHAGMNPFWSIADQAVFDGFDNGWMISYVGSHSGEYKMRLDFYGEVRHALTGLDLQVYSLDDPELRSIIREEIEGKVKVKKYRILPSVRCQASEHFATGDSKDAARLS